MKLAKGKQRSRGTSNLQLSTLRWSVDNLNRRHWRWKTTTLRWTFSIGAGQTTRQKLLKETLGVLCSTQVYTTIFTHKNCHLMRQVRTMQITIITQVVLLMKMQEFLYKDEHFFRNLNPSQKISQSNKWRMYVMTDTGFLQQAMLAQGLALIPHTQFTLV